MRSFDTNTLYLFEGFYAENEAEFTDGPLLLIGVKTSREVEVSKRFSQVFVVEPWEPNVQVARQLHVHAEVVQSTIQDLRLDHAVYGARTVVWLQGPEHVQTVEVKRILRRFMQTASLIVLEMPHGRYEQGPDGGNQNESHVTHWYERDFADLGDGWSLFFSHDRQPCETANETRHMLAVWRKR